jgi:uncharacterized DUF497 family protein
MDTLFAFIPALQDGAFCEGGLCKLDLYIQMMYNPDMKFEWDPEKNEQLKRERNISFEKIIFHLSQGDIWKIADHPDQENYPGQKIYFVIVEDYIYLVPHVVEKDYIFLKTIIPSRKATKRYQNEQEG